MLREVRFLGDASKNCIVWVRGYVLPEDESGMFEIFDIKDMAPSQHGRRPKTLTLASALWTLQEKLGFRVWTQNEKYPLDLLLLMESRNFIRFDRGITLEKWEGKLFIEPFNIPERKWFWFQLDFDKVFER